MKNSSLTLGCIRREFTNIKNLIFQINQFSLEEKTLESLPISGKYQLRPLRCFDIFGIKKIVTKVAKSKDVKKKKE